LHRQILGFARQFYLTTDDSHGVIPVFVESLAHLHRDFFLQRKSNFSTALRHYRNADSNSYIFSEAMPAAGYANA
ncbi:MAG: hypothetical protein PUP92_33270, partial [Rhizonema sp. PD38]|nr:hypothetical protein [Rhizonema sp. PD38]